METQQGKYKALLQFKTILDALTDCPFYAKSFKQAT
jgi:hypothetical protein